MCIYIYIYTYTYTCTCHQRVQEVFGLDVADGARLTTLSPCRLGYALLRAAAAGMDTGPKMTFEQMDALAPFRACFDEKLFVVDMKLCVPFGLESYVQ